MKKISSIFLLFLALNGCDKIDDPIPATAGDTFQLDGDTEFIVDPTLNIDDATALLDFISNKTWDTVTSPDNSLLRFAVLEEFTGHTCNNCPDGARRIEQLVGVYGDQLIPIAIHASNQFAAPYPSGSKFRSDHRVEGGYGDIYLNDLNIGALPQGIVSRSTRRGSQINQWESDFLAIKDDTPLASLKINSFYSGTDTLVRVQIEVEWLTNSTETYNLQLHLLESNIIDWQKDGALDVPDYNHKHMLRKVVNGAYGKQLKPAVAGDIEKIQYITAFNSKFKPENMEIVAFVFNSDPSSYEIIQGNAVHLKK
tara:strand:+ start:2459 stop:3391 length:933 start_codon:yes stop_codon:yes gene_type:complete